MSREFALKQAEEQIETLRQAIAQLEADIESIRRGYWEAQKHIDELEAENAELKREKEADDIRWMQIAYFVESLRMNTAEKGMVAGWLDELDEILNLKPDALLTEQEQE